MSRFTPSLEQNKNRRYLIASPTLATIAGTLGTAVMMAGAGVAGGMMGASAIKSAKDAKKAKGKAKGEAEDAAKRAADAPRLARQQAQDETDRKRRMRGMAGGRTILAADTGGAKTVLGG